MSDERDTEIARSNIGIPVRERIWGRSAARCVLCSHWLINASEFWHTIPTGEIAHNAGATSGANSPRSNSALSGDERALEENLLLLCHDCHRKIDSKEHRDNYSIDFLTSKKLTHEQRVREVTDFATLRPTTVLRLSAGIRGTLSPASLAQISEALRNEGLTGMGEDTRSGLFDIYLPDAESEVWSWDRAKAKIDDMTARAFDAIGAGDVSVLSVFAFGPIPVLVYLGSRLDDKTETIVYRRKRSDDVGVWTWPAESMAASLPAFTFAMDSVRHAAEDEVVVLVSISADISRDRIPESLVGMPVLEIRPESLQPGTDLIDSRAALTAFGEAWRAALSMIETVSPSARKIHVIAAVPTTAAVSMGRHHMRDAQPDLVLYQRHSDGSYGAVLEITA